MRKTMTNKYENVIFYCGPEVNHTAANGLKTLFVMGFRGTQQIIELANFNSFRAIHLGIHGTFQKNKNLASQLPLLLETGLRITLEYPIDAHQFVLDMLPDGVRTHPNFIPLINCEIDKIALTSKNLAVKFNDTEFGGGNRGVWTLPVNEIMDSNRFASWEDHENEEILLREEKKSKSKTSAKEEE